MKTLASLSVVFFFASTSVTMAQTPPPAPPAPTSGDYADALMNLDCATCEGKVESLRGFSLATPSSRPASAARPAQGPAPQADRSAPRRIATAGPTPPPRVSASDLKLNFRRGSAELTEDGEANARSFASALQDPRLAGMTFMIVGHTDATGSADRNLALSEQRAEAVKAFLVKQGIDASRLQTKGVGSQDLAVPSEPDAAANRRVEVKRAG